MVRFSGVGKLCAHEQPEFALPPFQALILPQLTAHYPVCYHMQFLRRVRLVFLQKRHFENSKQMFVRLCPQAINIVTLRKDSRGK
jgi:hypothetical protein